MMSLDINACLKAFSTAFSQYCSHPNDQTLKDVERQIDVLIGITSNGRTLKGFTVKELLPTECLTSLVSMLTERNSKAMLTSKCVSLLYCLATDNETRIVLRDSFHLTSTITGLLLYHQSRPTANDNIILQCLQLMQRITYECKIPVALGYVEELVKFLVNQIQLGNESELTLSSLGILANLCRNNIAVQAQIKALDNIKYIYRTLIGFLSHGNLTVIVYALSLLTSLDLQEPLREKLFGTKNINTTFQLVFNILINGEGILARKYSVDLFVDLLRSDKIRQSLLNYDYLSFYLEQVLCLLSRCEPDEATKIFELLLAFCGVSDLRYALLGVFLSMNKQGSGPCSTEESDESDDGQDFGCFLYWVNHAVDNNVTVSVRALEFLREIYEEIINNGLSTTWLSRVKILVPNLVKNLEPPGNVEGHSTKRKFQKIVCVLDVLEVLASEEAIAALLCRNIQPEIYQVLIEQQYRLNDIAMKGKLSFIADWSEMGVVVALKALDLMNRLKTFKDELKETVTELMKDNRLVSFLANTLINGKKEHIQTALRVLQESSKNPDFEVAWLGELIFSNNLSKEEELRSLRKRHDDIMASPVTDSVLDPSFIDAFNNPFPRRGGQKCSTFINSVHDHSTIESLIDKIKSGMEIKDPKASEIMDVYEAKLASLQTKEGHLQDLLEAKTLALSQSDRMISQYRCRRAQSEAECAKLRHLLQETERRCEAQIEEIDNLVESQKVAVQQMDQVTVQNRNLQLIASDHKQLKITFAEQNQRLETLKKALAAAQEEHKSLSELNEMLRRHNDNLKNQHDCATRQLQELEEERKKVVQQLKQQEVKLNELTQALEEQETKLHEKEKEFEKMRKDLEKNKAQLSKTEQARKELVHKFSSLEMVCSQRERTVKEREQVLKDQQKDLDKYAQMSAMIHRLTSGELPITQN